MRDSRVKEVLDEAARLPPGERERYVRDRCAGDPALTLEVLELLDDLQAVGGFLENPLPCLSAVRTEMGADVVREGSGSVIGRYTLVELVGEGGFGSVFRAEQHEPVRRTVALKIIKLGMDTRQVVARFEQERQALALMDHPGIAKVFDGGATETGRPYFVMELVRGEPITRYCDENKLGMRQRLEVFAQVCHAVQHAHQKGIIHRDLKPSNILVTVADGHPVPKIIDFGIAKATGPRLTQLTLLTEPRALIGTPEYMSPEQAEMGSVDIDTRTDIYSLGVLLYELLTGVTPFDPARLRSASWAELQRIIREDEPPRPGTISRKLRGDLETITLKALEKDRRHRYSSAAELGDDMRRYLNNQPITARPPSVTYLLRKFARRHKAVVGGVCAVILTLAAGVISTTIFALRADRRARETQQIAAFQARMFKEIRPDVMGEQMHKDLLAAAERAWRRLPDMTEEETDRRHAQLESLIGEASFTQVALDNLGQGIFDRALTMLHADDELRDQPLVKVLILKQLGETMRWLGLPDRSLDAFEEAWQIQKDELGSDNPETVDTMLRVADPLLAPERWQVAEQYAREALARRERAFAKDSPEVRSSLVVLGRVLQLQRRYDDAESYFRMALEGRDRSDLDECTLEATVRLGQTLLWREELSRAEPFLESGLARVSEAREKARLVSGEEGKLRFLTTGILGRLRADQGRLAEAERICRDDILNLTHRFGDLYRNTCFHTVLLGQALCRQGRYAEAEQRLQEGLAGLRRVPGGDIMGEAYALRALGVVKMHQGGLDAAEECLRQSLSMHPHVLRDDVFSGMLDLASVLAQSDDPKKVAEASDLVDEYLGRYDKTFPPGDPWTFWARRNVARHWHSLGRLPDAEAMAREAVEGYRSLHREPDEAMVKALGTLAVILRDAGHPEDALELFKEIEQDYRDHADSVGNPIPEYCWFAYTDCLIEVHRFLEAERVLLEAHSGYAAKDAWLTARVIDALIEVYEVWNAAEPNAGHDRRADEWRARRDGGGEDLQPGIPPEVRDQERGAPPGGSSLGP